MEDRSKAKIDKFKHRLEKDLKKAKKSRNNTINEVLEVRKLFANMVINVHDIKQWRSELACIEKA